jgi:hypothetical protein
MHKVTPANLPVPSHHRPRVTAGRRPPSRHGQDSTTARKSFRDRPQIASGPPEAGGLTSAGRRPLYTRVTPTPHGVTRNGVAFGQSRTATTPGTLARVMALDTRQALKRRYLKVPTELTPRKHE